MLAFAEWCPYSIVGMLFLCNMMGLCKSHDLEIIKVLHISHVQGILFITSVKLGVLQVSDLQACVY